MGRLADLKRIQREISDIALDRDIPKQARDDLHDAEWHVCSAHYIIRHPSEGETNDHH